MSGLARLLLVCDGSGTDASGRHGAEGDAALAALAAPLLAPGGRALLFSVVARPDEAEARRARLRTLAESLPGAEVEVAADGARPYLQVVRRAAALGAELVMKTADPSPRPAIALFASVDQHLLRKCPCPVWLLRPPLSAPHTVVAAIDLPEEGESAPAAEALNRTIVTTAARLAAPAAAAGRTATVRVLHAWEDPMAGVVRQWSGHGVEASVARSARTVEAAEHAGLTALMRKAGAWLAEAGLEAVRVQPWLVEGPPRQAVPQAIAELGADLLVMGTLARTGVAGVLIGNTAEDVLNAVDCDVAAVKPPGYVSPLLG
jgi:nucleotide-binding universal stress UspA family protein